MKPVYHNQLPAKKGYLPRRIFTERIRKTMKLWVIKHKGADYWGNYMHSLEIDISGQKIYAEIAFRRKKDAKAYLNAKPYPEFYEIVRKVTG